MECNLAAESITIAHRGQIGQGTFAAILGSPIDSHRGFAQVYCDELGDFDWQRSTLHRPQQ
jgi:hypothetical protein